MYDIDMYLITKDNPAGPIYVEKHNPALDEDRRFYDQDGNETKGSRIGRYLSYAVLAALLIWIWAH